MITWTVLAYGTALTAIAVALFTVFAGRERTVSIVVAVVAASVGAVVGWNSILQATSADELFTDFPVKVFPISWQDFGSGVFTVATVALVLGFGPLRDEPAKRAIALAAWAGLAALLVDMYLY